MAEEKIPIALRKVEFVTSAVKPSQYPKTSMPEIAFAGRSNVGKSSLINVLVNRRQLVKVSGTPGRTQLINFFNINDEISFVDLPGYGFAKVPDRVKRDWGKMIENYLGKRPNLLSVVIIMDLRRGIQEDDRQLIEVLPHFGLQPVIVFTKADKYKRTNARKQRVMEIAKQENIPVSDILAVSSLKKFGVTKLWQRILDITRAHEQHLEDEVDYAEQEEE